MPHTIVESPLVLVIDDDIVTTSLLAKVLAKYGYRVHVANDPQKGLSDFYVIHPRVVILDVNMPGMNGYEVCQAMRSTNYNQCIPIMMLTDQGDSLAIEKAFDSGATDFLNKPINWELLRHRLRFALRAYETDEILRKTQQNLVYAQQLAKLGYWEWEIDSDIIIGSDNVFQLFGHSISQNNHSRAHFMRHLTQSSLEDLDKGLQRLLELNEQELPLEGINDIVHISHPSGKTTILNIFRELKTNEKGTRYILGTAQDITQLTEAEATVSRLSLHDSLTELPNRRFFLELLSQELQKRANASTDSNQGYISVLTLDIDRFKLFNQSLGNHGGDLLLRAFSDRLVQITRENDQVARLGSDEFAILLEMGPQDQIESIASRYHNALIAPFMIGQEEVFITPSMGVSIAPSDADQAEGLIACANAAKTRAKRAGGNQYQFYTANMNQQASKRIKLEHDLRRAIELNQLVLFYQPKIASDGLHLIGAEALIRWQHPEWGMVSPVDFIPIAEETGMILEIGKWVLNEACRQTSIWRKHVPHFHMAVNLSARQFLQDDLIEQVRQALSDNNLTPDALDLEITESLAMADAERNITILHQLKAIGISLSIDDFGTGYSSLSYLQAFPVDTIKIDRSFIMRIGTDESKKSDEGIASSIVAMAHSLDMSLVAEGVENETQVAFLVGQGCEVLQGFHFGKPLPAVEFTAKFHQQLGDE